VSASTSTRPSTDTAQPLALPDRPSIAVLPFTNMSGDSEQDYFADGMAEDIITALSHFKALFVIARNSSFTYKGRAVDVKQVGRELGVRYVLEGSVRKAANRVRITGQLVDTATGGHLWADRFESCPHFRHSLACSSSPSIQRRRASPRIAWPFWFERSSRAPPMKDRGGFASRQPMHDQLPEVPDNRGFPVGRKIQLIIAPLPAAY
jgi:TolB-like protein